MLVPDSQPRYDSRVKKKHSFWLPKKQFLGAPLFAALALAAAFSARAKDEDPWMAEQMVQPAQLVAELQQSGEAHPMVIYVGFKTLYAGAHIPGAVYHGPGSTEQGISELKKYAARLGKNSDVVLYCGCCPLEKCPNLRPAFRALKEMGISRLRVLILPNNFNADWVQKGYPVRRGSKP
jgi:thiosulfate/3-mercaptopyruvate sulfurtransferase